MASLDRYAFPRSRDSILFLVFSGDLLLTYLRSCAVYTGIKTAISLKQPVKEMARDAVKTERLSTFDSIEPMLL